VNVIVLDTHPYEDDRIKRHIRYLIAHKVNVYSVNINRHDKCLEEGHFSRSGERGYRINPCNLRSGLVNSIGYNLYCLSSRIAKDMFSAFDSLGIDLSSPTIVHVHDPSLLPVAGKIKQKIPGVKLVYDRHEVFERSARIWGVNIPKVGRVMEKISTKKVDGVVVISNDYADVVKSMFQNSLITVVQNFPSNGGYSPEDISSKIHNIQSGSIVNLVYVGSLNHDYDRDIDLILRIASDVLSRYQNTQFFIGGQTTSASLLEQFKRLSNQYHGRFHYLGYITRREVISVTQAAHIGFFLLKPDTSYWVKCSPNKVFEYLRCGVIPVVRADCDYAHELTECAMIFERSSDDFEIIEGVRMLIEQPSMLKSMMEKAHTQSHKFSFEGVAKNYLDLYNNLLKIGFSAV
jgi:glycosyltransferase involved in cell wall biosynthesis